MTVQEVLDWLEERHASEHDQAGMARYGIRTEDARETRLLAAMVEDPERVTLRQMDRWALGFDFWDVRGVCMDLFRHTPHAERKLIALLARRRDVPDEDLDRARAAGATPGGWEAMSERH